jgi:hypothetical protein
MIFVLAGTQDGREIVRLLLEQGHDVAASVVSSYGGELLAHACGQRCLINDKPLDEEALKDYLQEHDFSVYVVSGSDRYICRELFEGMVDVPSDHFIGMDVALEASGQGDADTLDYTFQPGDELVRTDVMQVKNLKTNKVTAIMREIGQQPVLSFGNTSGDTAMHLYTISNNPYKALAFMLIADDDVRDYGHPEKADELRQKWEGLGFQVISMKNDFRTIYGENVKKTGTFHWTEELSGR